MKTLQCALIVVFTLISIGFTVNDVYGAAYIKFDGINGESQDKGHEEWIELLSVSESLHKPVASSGSTRDSSTVVEDIVVTKQLDKASPKIAEKLVKGETIATVRIELCSESGDKSECYLSYEFTNVIITSYSVGGTGQETPVEEISFNFEKLVRKDGGVETKESAKPPPSTPPSGPEGDGSEEPPPPTEMKAEEPVGDETKPPTSEESPKEEATTEPTPEELETVEEIKNLPASQVAKLPAEKLAKITPKVFKELPKSTVRNLSPDGIQGLPDDTVKSLTPKQFKKLALSTIRGLEPGLIEKLPAQTKQVLSPKIDQFPMKIPKSTVLQQGIPGQERYGFKLPKLFIAPYAQLLTGVSAEDILCNEGFELVMKTSNGKPACVISSSVDKLVERGWATK